ncbi:MAG: AAA family ATPase [Planctomycetes bacterium]|nr:AAA family ATPase [Planctomycetota bacterium]
MIDPLPADALRWRCSPDHFSFESTAEVAPIAGVVGQSSALEALKFGLECDAPGQNIFVRGLRGTGRMTMVRRLLDELRPLCRIQSDRCYVHNFKQPDRPRLLTLPPGTAREFRRRLRDLAEFIASGLPEAMNDESLRESRRKLQEQIQERAKEHSAPLEEQLKQAGLALVSMQVGNVTQTAIFPRHEDKPIPPDQLEALVAQGAAPAAALEEYEAKVDEFRSKLEETTAKVSEIYRKGAAAIQELIETTARRLLRDALRPVRAQHPSEAVERHLDELVEDVVDRLGTSEEFDPARRYGVNIISERDVDGGCPIVVENTPTLVNLLGTVDPEFSSENNAAVTDYSRIRAGSLLRADGGYLILDANDLLSEPGSWKVLIRTLRTGKLEIIPAELGWPFRMASINPEPIPLSLRVILLGGGGLYYVLDQSDPDFQDLFKVLADFDSEIERNEAGLAQYAGVLGRIANEESLLHFDRTAVAALCEHGARIAARENKLTARFGRLADIAREASFLAAKRGVGLTSAEDVQYAVTRTKNRGSLPSRRFQELVSSETIKVETRGSVIGQINGLAVIQAGPLTYGFPARITATIGAGNAGVIDIESSSSMSGSIHTKGFHILEGLLRHLLPTDHPLTFSASLTFEQSYGGIDGDSASGAEICCLLSALTNVPIRQSLAMTGAIDQHGRVQAIGGVNEKVEGFFDTCVAAGLTGDQGVIIPQSNAGDLMLRQDVVEACAAGRFSVYSVRNVHEALETLTGVPAGRLHDGEYEEGTLLRRALERAHEYWVKTRHTPQLPNS